MGDLIYQIHCGSTHKNTWIIRLFNIRYRGKKSHHQSTVCQWQDHLLIVMLSPSQHPLHDKEAGWLFFLPATPHVSHGYTLWLKAQKLNARSPQLSSNLWKESTTAAPWGNFDCQSCCNSKNIYLTGFLQVRQSPQLLSLTRSWDQRQAKSIVRNAWSCTHPDIQIRMLCRLT